MPSTAVADVGSPRRKSFCDPREPRYASATQPARLAGWAALHGLNVLRFACSSVYAFARKCPSFTARLAHRLSNLIRCWADFTKGPRLRQPSFVRQLGPIRFAGGSTTNRKVLLASRRGVVTSLVDRSVVSAPAEASVASGLQRCAACCHPCNLDEQNPRNQGFLLSLL